jgi:hypothetical protein
LFAPSLDKADFFRFPSSLRPYFQIMIHFFVSRNEQQRTTRKASKIAIAVDIAATA